MNSQSHGSSQAVRDWIVNESKTYPGKKYYFNTKTKVTTWRCPRELQAVEVKNVTNQQRKVLKAVRPSSKISCAAKINTGNNKDVIIATPAKDKIKQTEKRKNVKNVTSNLPDVLARNKGSYTIPKKKNEVPPTTQGKVAKGICKSNKKKSARQCNVNEKLVDVLKKNVRETKSIKEIKNNNTTPLKEKPLRQSPKTSAIKQTRTSSANERLLCLRKSLTEEIKNNNTTHLKEKLSRPSPESSGIKQIGTSSANERLLSLRKSFTEETEKQLPEENTAEYIPRHIDLEVPMEIDIIIDEIKQVRDDALSLSLNLLGNKLPLIRNKENMSNGSIVIVADTNVFIGNFDVIEMIIISQIKNNGVMPVLVVPWRVINELDFLKSPKDKQQHSLMFRAKRALDFLYKMLPTHPRIKGQTLKDANHHIFPCEVPDDEILNCCLQIANDSHTVILLSCDKNLCNKAVINGIKAVNAKEMESMLQSAPDPNESDVNKSNISLNQNELQLFQDALLRLLSRVLEDEMKRKFDNMWEMIVFKRPPWSLGDVLTCLVKHWMAVISELFPRMQDVVKELSQMVNRRSKNLWLNQDIIKFKDLSLKLAEKCILLPEYSGLARECIQILKNDEGTPTDNNLNVQTKVISALENIWSFFSSFSAIIARNANIPHTLDVTYEFDENMDIKDSLHDVLSQLTLLITHVERVLSQCGNTLDQFTMIQGLCLVINDTLKGIGAGSAKIEIDELTSFCLSNRGLLEAVPAKFIQLYKLLSECDARLKPVC